MMIENYFNNTAINNKRDLRTSTTTSTNDSYMGDTIPSWWKQDKKIKDDLNNYGYIDDTYTSINNSVLIAKINELEKRIDKLTELLESVVG